MLNLVLNLNKDIIEEKMDILENIKITLFTFKLNEFNWNFIKLNRLREFLSQNNNT